MKSIWSISVNLLLKSSSFFQPALGQPEELGPTPGPSYSWQYPGSPFADRGVETLTFAVRTSIILSVTQPANSLALLEAMTSMQTPLRYQVEEHGRSFPPRSSRLCVGHMADPETWTLRLLNKWIQSDSLYIIFQCCLPRMIHKNDVHLSF